MIRSIYTCNTQWLVLNVVQPKFRAYSTRRDYAKARPDPSCTPHIPQFFARLACHPLVPSVSRRRVGGVLEGYRRPLLGSPNWQNCRIGPERVASLLVEMACWAWIWAWLLVANTSCLATFMRIPCPLTSPFTLACQSLVPETGSSSKLFLPALIQVFSHAQLVSEN